MLKKIDKIETKRLILSGITENDATDIVKWRADPSVYMFFKNPHKITLSEHLYWFKYSYTQNPNRIDWLVYKKSGDKCGVFGIIIHEKAIEISYILAPKEQHKGFATEVLQTLIPYLKKKYSPQELTAEIHLNNLPSIALVKKFGFFKKYQSGDFSTYCLNMEDI